jgi:hypothetical protein
MLAVERQKTLQMICFDNPNPGEWQPLPETCEGVEKNCDVNVAPTSE